MKGRCRNPRAQVCGMTCWTLAPANLPGEKVGMGSAVALVAPYPRIGKFGSFCLGRSPISGEREWGFLDSGGAWVVWMGMMREFCCVLSEDLEAELFQLFLSYGQPHAEDFEHLEFHISDVPATEDASDTRPIAVGMGKVEGILERETR